MAGETNRLIDLAKNSKETDPRNLCMETASGEQVSAALLAMS